MGVRTEEPVQPMEDCQAEEAARCQCGENIRDKVKEAMRKEKEYGSQGRGKA